MDFMNGLCVFCTFVFLGILPDDGFAQQQSTACKQSGGAYAWLSCLIAKANKDRCNPSGCARYAGTEFEKDLTCSFQKQKCGGCVPEYKLNGTEVSCNALEQTGHECPPGVQMEVCNLDACVATVCRPYLTAPCRNNFCGGCFAEYDVDGQWRRCPIEVSAIQPDNPVILGHSLDGFPDPVSGASFAGNPVVSLEPVRSNVLPSKPIVPNTCPNGELPWDCPADVCTNAYCSAYPQAKCRINNCGGCRPEFTTGIYVIQDCNSRECPKNTLEMVCKDDPCKYSTCKKYEDKNPVCRPSRCGGCRAMWYVDGQEVDCYEQYGVDVPCPNGESRQKCPETTCRFKYCPVDRSITCVINNCGGCHREYHKLMDSGRSVIVDESRCQGWWNIATNRKKKTFTKKKPLPRPVSELSPNEIDPMARRNTQRTVNAIEKFETGPKDSLNVKTQVEPVSSVVERKEPKMLPKIPPPQIPKDLLDKQPGIQQFMPKSNIPEVPPSDPSAVHVLDNPLISPPDTVAEYPQFLEAAPIDPLYDYPQNNGVVETSNNPAMVPGNVEIIDNPLLIEQQPTNPTSIVQNSEIFPENQRNIGFKVMENPLLQKPFSGSKINAVPLEQVVSDDPSLSVGKSKVYPENKDSFGVNIMSNPLSSDPMGSNIAKKQISPSVPGGVLTGQTINMPSSVKRGDMRSSKTVAIPPQKQQIANAVVGERISVTSLDSTTPGSSFVGNKGLSTPKEMKKKKPHRMNFWQTDMRLPPSFFKFMLQGMGFHGIPLEGIQK